MKPDIIDWQQALHQSTRDEMVGITIAKIAGTDEFSSCVAEIMPTNKWGFPLP